MFKKTQIFENFVRKIEHISWRSVFYRSFQINICFLHDLCDSVDEIGRISVNQIVEEDLFSPIIHVNTFRILLDSLDFLIVLENHPFVIKRFLQIPDEF